MPIYVTVAFNVPVTDGVIDAYIRFLKGHQLLAGRRRQGELCFTVPRTAKREDIELIINKANSHFCASVAKKQQCVVKVVNRGIHSMPVTQTVVVPANTKAIITTEWFKLESSNDPSLEFLLDIATRLINRSCDAGKLSCDTMYNLICMPNILELFLKHRFNLNRIIRKWPGPDGPCTLLTLAVYGGPLQSVKLLLEAGADVNFGGPKPPLTYAMARGEREIIDLLIAHGAKP